jgi:hypothetical protein
MTPTECPSPFTTDQIEAVCCENVIGNRWVAIRHPKNDKYDPKNALLFSEHRITQLTVWLMKAARWVSEGKPKNGKIKKAKPKKMQNAKS